VRDYDYLAESIMFLSKCTSTVEFDPGCEAMIYSTEGVPLQGITGGYGGDRRVEHIIPRKAIEAGQYDFVIESSCNGMFGVPWSGDTIDPPDVGR
jgi:alpha-mannosidase